MVKFLILISLVFSCGVQQDKKTKQTAAQSTANGVVTTTDAVTTKGTTTKDTSITDITTPDVLTSTDTSTSTSTSTDTSKTVKQDTISTDVSKTTVVVEPDTQEPTQASIHVNWRTPLSWDNNGGDTFTSSRNVTLLLHAGDDVGVTSVAISNTNNCADGVWEDYTPETQVSALNGDSVYQKSWTITPTRGTANVSAKFKDAAGNVSSCTTASIQAVTTNNATDIYVGTNDSCFIDNGHAKCWGGNGDGQLGYGPNASALGADMPSIDLGTGRTVRELAVGNQHTCALLDNYGVKCWGYNLYGQLGYGNTTTVTTMGDSLAYVNLGGNVAHIAAGNNHTCAIMSTGDVKCWGHNSRGQLGVGNSINIGDYPNPVFTSASFGSGKTAIQIALGSDFSCAILNDHTVKCWGANINNQLGQDGGVTGDIGITSNQLSNLSPILVGVDKTVSQISAGLSHVCAVLNDGGVKCWGLNTYGQRGYAASYGTGNNRPYVNYGPSYMSTAYVYASGNNTCVTTTENKIKCWGQNGNGQLGQGNTTSVGAINNMYDDTILPFIDLGTNRLVTKVVAGSAFSCALMIEGTIKCWGSNVNGKLGLNPETSITGNNLGDQAGEMGSNIKDI